MKRLLVGILFLLVGACASGENLSPREQAAVLMTQHITLLTGVEAVLNVPAVAENPDLVASLKRGTQVATAAVNSYVDAAKMCERQADGTISGVGCNPNQTAALLPLARDALLALQAELARAQGASP